jgi:hypothetical protein
MNKLPNPYMKKIKDDIRNRYLAGETIRETSLHYGVTTRDIYYHLGKISPEEKALHIKNYSLRNMTKKYKNKKKIKVVQVKERHEEFVPTVSKESESQDGSIGLAGFE